MLDVYSYGVVAPSTLIELAGDYPPPSGYAEIAGIRASIGGEAASSAYVLARLGVATKLAGNRLGKGASSALDILSGAGVDCSAIATAGDGDGVTEVIISHGDGRTIFGTYARLIADQAWDEPSEEDIRTSRIVNADPFFGNQSLAVSRLCRQFGTPYVTVDAAPDSEMAHHAEVVIVSHEFTARTVGSADPGQVLARYTDQCQGLVIFTRGADGAWWARGVDPMANRHAFSVEVRDTTGAGDAFRAGIVYGLLQGLGGDRLVRVGAATAALVCQTAPGVLNSPTATELEAFLAAHP
jgi:sugar/nucleoside kinase (ribokinase family)